VSAASADFDVDVLGTFRETEGFFTRRLLHRGE
jgi:hypothetical protein